MEWRANAVSPTWIVCILKSDAKLTRSCYYLVSIHHYIGAWLFNLHSPSLTDASGRVELIALIFVSLVATYVRSSRIIVMVSYNHSNLPGGCNCGLEARPAERGWKTSWSFPFCRIRGQHSSSAQCAELECRFFYEAKRDKCLYTRGILCR